MPAGAWPAAPRGGDDELYGQAGMASPGRFVARPVCELRGRAPVMRLELRNVSKRFPGVLAVDDVSFEARGGEVTGYLGPNGSGKSTTMKMITGLIGTT